MTAHIPRPQSYLGAFAAVVMTMLLNACGGGTGDGVTVSNLQATPTAYSQAMRITVFGTNLQTGLTVDVDEGCINLAPVAALSSDLQQTYTCTVRRVGSLTARARNNDGKELGRVTVNIPQPQVTLNLNQGTIVVELDADKAPNTVINFLAYVNAAFYSNTLFHRVEKGVSINGGGYTAGVAAKTTGLRTAIALENTGLKNTRGSIAMFRDATATSTATATSQYFFNLADNPQFDAGSTTVPDGYAVFGSVVKGQDVLDSIANVPVGDRLQPALNFVPDIDVVVLTMTQTR